MELHEVEISEGIIYLEYQVRILQETLNYLLQNIDPSALDGLDENKLKRNAANYIKDKYPDAGIQRGDWI